MKKIYINNTKRAVFFGSTMLLPGSNAVEEIDKDKFPTLAKMIDADEIEESDDPARAVKMANTQSAVEAIAGMANGDGKTQENARKRSQQLNKIKEEAEAAAAAAKKAKSEEEKEKSEEEGA